MPEQFTGKVEIKDSTGKTIFVVDPDASQLKIVYQMATGQPLMLVSNTGGLAVVGDIDNGGARLDAKLGHLILGGGQRVAKVFLLDGTNKAIILLDATSASAFVGTSGTAGNIFVRDVAGKDAIELDGQNATLRIGIKGNEGDLVVRDTAGRDTLHLDGQNAVLRIGTKGNEGDIVVRDTADRDTFHLDGQNAVLRVGNKGNEGDIIVRNNKGAEVIHLNGGSGDIILSNADCAEDFDMDSISVEPGTVMVIGSEGGLRPSSVAYDKTVAGVISGAGKCKPGIVLDRHSSQTPRSPLALLGKVYCKVDATYASVEVGDLLTTSSTPGHAMKASDPLRAFGAVIGKALRPLPGDTGLIPILVALQ